MDYCPVLPNPNLLISCEFHSARIATETAKIYRELKLTANLILFPLDFRCCIGKTLAQHHTVLLHRLKPKRSSPYPSAIFQNQSPPLPQPHAHRREGCWFRHREGRSFAPANPELSVVSLKTQTVSPAVLTVALNRFAAAA
ncbi:hypothetical protein U1Q18_034434 [Sarracenia purpurea var. burkii]